jgi:hypothetical protein
MVVSMVVVCFTHVDVHAMVRLVRPIDRRPAVHSFSPLLSSLPRTPCLQARRTVSKVSGRASRRTGHSAQLASRVPRSAGDDAHRADEAIESPDTAYSRALSSRV